jgi:MFS family permease
MNKTALLLLLTEFIFLLGSGLYGPIYAIFVQRVGGNILDAGIAWAIYLITMATLGLVFGKLIDKHGKKKFLAPAYLLAAISIFGYIFVSSTWQLFLIQLSMGIAVAMGDPAWDSWFSNAVPKKESAFHWSMFNAINGYGQGIGALVGGALAQFIGFQFMFLVAGIFGIISFFMILTIKEF